MSLTGTYNRTIDDKHRLAVPKPVREAFHRMEVDGVGSKVLYVCPGLDTSLMLFGENGFQNFSARFAQVPANRQDVRQYALIFYSLAERVELDSQGRIRIPDRLIEFAQLSKDAVLLGVRDHAEVWDTKLWDSFMQKHRADFDKVAAKSLE